MTMQFSIGQARSSSDCILLPLSELPEDMLGVAKQRLQKNGGGVAVVPTADVLIVVYEPQQKPSEPLVAWRLHGQRVGRCLASETPQQVDATLPLDDDAAATFAAGIAAGYHSYTAYMKPAAKKSALVKFRVLDGSKKLLQRITVTTAAQQLARDLTNTPAMDLGPAEFVSAARQALKGSGVRITVYSAAQLKQKKAGAILAVGSASDRAPRMLHLSWPGNKSAQQLQKTSQKASQKTLQKPAWTLCGKGICFDTGGLQIKPGTAMSLMRKDMGGAAAVLAALKAAAVSKPAHRIDAWIPLADNAIAGNAFRPGDILTAADGTTIEVGHTDAEGRLVLADALSLARRDQPQALVTVATLTGAALVALGRVHVPVMGDDGPVSDVLSAAEAAGERGWCLPLIDEHKNMVKGQFADLTNSAGPDASCITAGAFLQHFAGDIPFAHCDISPVSWQPSANKHWAAGATGTWAATLTELISQKPTF